MSRDIKIEAGSIIRDFIDIDDVIYAYDAILDKGVIGEVYNVCDGRGHSIHEIVCTLSEFTNLPITLEMNEELLRPIDNPVLIGSFTKLQKIPAGSPQLELKKVLKKSIVIGLINYHRLFWLRWQFFPKRNSSVADIPASGENPAKKYFVRYPQLPFELSRNL